jgi:hypothetical protein
MGMGRHCVSCLGCQPETQRSYGAVGPDPGGQRKKHLGLRPKCLTLRAFLGSPTWARTRDLRINSQAGLNAASAVPVRMPSCNLEEQGETSSRTRTHRSIIGCLCLVGQTSWADATGVRGLKTPDTVRGRPQPGLDVPSRGRSRQAADRVRPLGLGAWAARFATCGLTRVGTTDDRSASMTGQPSDAAGMAAAARPLSPVANWYYRPSAALRASTKLPAGSANVLRAAHPRSGPFADFNSRSVIRVPPPGGTPT